MGKSKAKDLTIMMIICPDDMDINGITEKLEARMRQVARLGVNGYCREESAHAQCHCGSRPIIFPSGHRLGEKSSYNIRCGGCGDEPMLGSYYDSNRSSARIDFPTEEAALAVWDAMMGAGLSNG